jgi:hypothetical protein
VKKAWEIIKDTTGKTQASEAVIKEIFSESGQITDHREIANAFNKFFIQMDKNLNNKDINAYKALQLLKGVNTEAINRCK